MKLTQKDLQFLLRLKSLVQEHDLEIELKQAGGKMMVLRKNYGNKIEKIFGMSRQGVRWRFQRLFNDVYVNAYVTICWLESTFGTHLRAQAIEIAQERMALCKRMNQANQSYQPK